MTLNILSSMQYATINGKELTVVKTDDWEQFISYLETVKDVQQLRQIITELKLKSNAIVNEDNLELSNVTVTAFSAKQMVTQFVVDYISTNMHGSMPSLVVGNCTCWRVPVMLSMIPVGDMGQVGVIDVDIETGQLQINSTLIKELISSAEGLITRSSPKTKAA